LTLLSAAITLKAMKEITEEDARISREHWEWVRGLIRDIEREEKKDEFLKLLFQWDLAVREFRKVELAAMILGQPNEKDFHFHAICLHSLLAMGHSLILMAEPFDPREFEYCRVQHAHITTYLEELEQSFREWHHGFNESEIAETKAKIFRGPS
jgi:hypothetical protein